MTDTEAPRGQSSPARATVSTPSDREIRVERVFDAPRAKVWRAYSEPAALAQWWGRGNAVDVERFEFEKGGHWRFVEHAGGTTHGFEGRFREIVPQERIVQTFEWDGMPAYVLITTVNFEDIGANRTRVTSVSLFHTTEERDGFLHSGMEGGLNQSYAALDGLLPSL